MVDPVEVLLGLLMPAVLALACALFARRESVAAPLVGVGVAIALAQWALTGWRLAPVESIQRHPWFALSLAIVVAVATAVLRGGLVRFVLLVAASAVCAWSLLHRRLESIEGAPAWAMVAGHALGCAAFATMVATLASRLEDPAGSLLLAALAGATAALALFAGSFKLAQIGGAIAAACLGCAVAGFMRRVERDGVRAEGRFLIGLGSIVGVLAWLVAANSAYFSFGGYSPWLWALIGAGALAPTFAIGGPHVPANRWKALMVRGAFAAVPLGIAVAIAFKAYGSNPYR